MLKQPRVDEEQDEEARERTREQQGEAEPKEEPESPALISPTLPEKDPRRRTDNFKIRNHHTHFPLDFVISYQLPASSFQGTLSIVPESGSIPPNESQVVSVTLTSDGVPSTSRMSFIANYAYSCIDLLFQPLLLQ